ncbi:TPA: tyrosine-type recombinase/integrase [Vibrio cholerae]|uniref:tyrosine-type recombinase/integrase n=1 Tax=Vibrio cholerae TaxID=666 RepID=UPI0015838154|nr:site-specific integrase [Vibrio cholerae]QKU65591.1 site-specific integrase [Vibrio cholerae]
MSKAKAQANTLTSHQVTKVFNRIRLMSNPHQKAAIIALSLSGLRVTELSKVAVSDLVTKRGEIRSEIALRATITKGCKPRPIWLSERTRKLLQVYIDHRLERKQGVSLRKEYQGLNASSSFILSAKGFPYSLKAKHRVAHDGTVKTYYAADSVELLVREIYKKCGLKGASSHSGRRSLASNLNAANVPLETIARTLGHREIQTSLVYIEITPKQLEKAAELAI